MSVAVTISFHSDNPNTIWNVLAKRLGREPTGAEATAEVRRILDEAQVARAMAGRLRFQRGHAA